MSTLQWQADMLPISKYWLLILVIGAVAAYKELAGWQLPQIVLDNGSPKQNTRCDTK